MDGIMSRNVILIILLLIFIPICLNGDSYIIYKNGLYTIKYSSITLRIENKLVKIPIFKGDKGHVDYNSLSKLNYDPFDVISKINIDVKKGDVKKTMLQLVEFYHNNLLKHVDIYKPAEIGFEGNDKNIEAIIWYIFNYEGIDFSMMIGVGAKINNEWRDIRKIAYNENKPYIYINLLVGKHCCPK
jgi:hypothetical protein